MEIFHLRYFVAVAEKLSFSGAARSLHMATSPLSQRIRDLERELGVVLFERDSHHVQLTDAGSSLLPIAREALSRFDDVPWRLREAIGRTRPVVYLGVPPGLHSTLRERLTGFTRRCAEVCDLKRWPGGSRELLLGVQRGELAMALVHLPVHAEGIEVAELMREPLGAVLPAPDFAGRESVSLHELVGLTYVRPAARMLPDYWDELEARLSAAGIHRRMTLDTGDYGSTAEVIANGGAFAISMLDPRSGMQKLRDDSITVLPIQDFSPSLATGLIWRQDRTEVQLDLHELIDEAKQFLADPVA
ncbi:LysR family transcriptional regulator [Saccharopolyspora sp. TS4A08]|uniref:LysR family transcriptional regulator n=1 Tax=Saccharopolyspora ipomoeae TaxID=3042027 RepID=A0ABT6PQS0_9PSEU|nr:LysR family transcriptional regulator [Saccharopolyspora sp. TS4A08]MDI2029801.1 LysR family transcriptional regulator [Saccharopolyspora sp. TS4A08]